MKFEVVEATGEWIVRHCDVEVARFREPGSALNEVSRRLREADVGDGGASVAVRYQAPASRAP
jgi:hypothetical protein